MALAAAAGLTGCDIRGFMGWKWRQRLMLEVETPRGLVTGGSVVGVKIWKSAAPGDASGMLLSDIEGEASFVEVTPGRYLFALLGGDSTPGLPLDLFFPPPRLSSFERAEQLESMSGKALDVPRELYPLLVTFDDINDPKTVKRVDPANLAASFGPGVTFRRITLEITDDPVSSGRVDDLLTWLGNFYGKMFDGNRYQTIEASNRFANSLSSGAFAAGN